MTAGAGQNKSEVECWHVHRRCFAWSFSVGTLVVLLGVTCLLLGFLLPRHSALVSQMEDNDVKMWMSAHSTNSEPSISSLNIIDRQAIEHNNVLDTLKMGGGIATCFGCFLLLMTFIFPPGSHPSKWADEGETSQISQINQALKNCLLSVHSKNHPTFFYSGLVASTTNEKIPVFQQLQSVQPKD
jgi:hypothetical protein